MQYYLTQPWYYLLVLIVDLAAAFICVLALWTGESQKYWFRGGLLLGGTLALLVPIRAYEPLLLFLLMSPLLAGTSVWQTWLHKAKWRFTLRDAFQLLTLLGIWLALWTAAVRGMPLLNWQMMPIAAVLISIVASRAWNSPRHMSRWQTWVKLAFSILALTLAECLLLGDWLYSSAVFGLTSDRGWPSFKTNFPISLFLYVPFAFLIMLGSCLLRVTTCSAEGRILNQFRARAIGSTLLLFTFVPAAWLYWQMLIPPIPPQSSTADAESFDRLLTIGRELARASPAASKQMLSEAHELLSRPGRVPLNYGEVPEAQEKELASLQSLKHVLATESDLAASAGNAGKKCGAIWQSVGDIGCGSPFWGRLVSSTTIPMPGGPTIWH
ncbi:MAG: hypothetical protein K8R36_01535 [Planctomycetales bacterium]|nr:hypothetical protein [Planctomycetales bacterium]